MDELPKKIFLRGYTKKENNHWVAKCIDLNIVAQGKTAEGAKQECVGLIIEYIDYVYATYPNDYKKYIPRPNNP